MNSQALHERSCNCHTFVLLMEVVSATRLLYTDGQVAMLQVVTRTQKASQIV